jgi:predicted Zn-dependent peptidase
VYFHDPNLINTVLSNYSEVTPADIQRVARQYLGATQRTIVLTNPKAQTAPAAQ